MLRVSVRPLVTTYTVALGIGAILVEASSSTLVLDTIIGIRYYRDVGSTYYAYKDKYAAY